MAAELMSAGEAIVSPAMAGRVGALARDAQPWERGRAAADLTAIGDASILALLATVPESLDG